MTVEKATSYKDATTYNNFYEFGVDKSDPARNAHTLKAAPWSIEVEGLVKKTHPFQFGRCHEMGRHARAYLPHALRRRLVHGHPLDWLLIV